MSPTRGWGIGALLAVMASACAWSAAAARSSAGGCWRTYRPFETGQYLAPRLPVAAPRLTYAPVEHIDGVVRLGYRYWTWGPVVQVAHLRACTR